MLATSVPTASVLCACSSLNKEDADSSQSKSSNNTLATSDFVVAIEDEPDTVDFQCTSIYYTVAINVFDRLVETETDDEGNAFIAPSLAESWEESDDGRTYTFHLREGVTFSNGSVLTSSDVLYTFMRLLTHPESCNRDIADPILGADRVANGETDQLEGFTVVNDRDFTITLTEPFEAFLACLSMPGASILNAESVKAAGDRFGKDAAHTIGTGPYILSEWEPGQGMLITATNDCWWGAPNNSGIDMRFIDEPEEIRRLFDTGELDVLDLDDIGNAAEFYIHGNVYQDKLYKARRIGTTYIALNETVAPLNDVRVRKALQLSLNRSMLLDAARCGVQRFRHGRAWHLSPWSVRLQS